MSTVRLLAPNGLVLPLVGIDFVSAATGDALLPNASSLLVPVAIAYDSASRLYIVEQAQNGASRLRYLAANGSLFTTAGAGGSNFLTASYYVNALHHARVRHSRLWPTYNETGKAEVL